jgi:hypothetical protein
MRHDLKHPFQRALRRKLQADGYCIHRGSHVDGRERARKYWFTWCQPGLAEAEVGPTCRREREAWLSALMHRLTNSVMNGGEPAVSERPADLSHPVGPFREACIPASALEVNQFAAKFNLTRDVAAEQIGRLRRQSVHVNDRYQVNTERVVAPFGDHAGDVLWLSIRRRDRATIHDWRELQEIKNRIVGPENEGFEIYPAESRLVDTANQFHLWVFVDRRVRLPVGFTSRMVGGPEAAHACGARQRSFKPVL